LKALYVIFLILLNFSGPLHAEETTNEDAQEKGIEISQEEESASETYEVSSINRKEHLYPSNWGTVGIFRTRSAESLPFGALSFGIGGEFYSVGNAPDFGTGKQANSIAENLFVGYSPLNNLTLAVVRRNSSTTFGTPKQLISSLGDFNFSAVYSFPINDTFAVAPIGNFLIASNFNSLSPAVSTLSGGIGVLGTASLYPSTGLPLFFHLNLLYHMPQIRSASSGILASETFYEFSRFSTINTALGVEYKLGDFIPFLEFQHTHHLNSSLGWTNSPARLSVGARFTPLDNKSLALLLGTDVAVNRGLSGGAPVAGIPFMPDYQILGQVSYTFGITQTERKHYFTTSDVNIVDRKFVIRKNINFKVGSAELLRNSYSLLDQIAEVIKENKVRKLLISGHTDSTHTEAYNLKLSLARANSVKAYLVSKGIPEDSLVTQGFGKRKPKASNASERGRKLNRRVEFFILE
jgi:outer membrane protein OmpA-like peptidoglycan-associated protein